MEQTGNGGTRRTGVLSVALPPGWDFKESITLLAPDGQANVIASTEPLDPSITARDYAAEHGKVLEEFPEYIEHALEPATVFGDLQGWLRQFEWTPPDEEDEKVVVQVQMYAVADGRGYTATATAPTAHFSRYERQLYDILSQLVRRST